MKSDSPIDFSSIDTAVHGPIRLGVLTALQADGALDFTTLKRRLGVADGAIGTHLQKLETIGYVTCTKEFVGRRPRSTYCITEQGRRSLLDYLEMMQQLINSLTNANQTKPEGGKPEHGT